MQFRFFSSGIRNYIPLGFGCTSPYRHRQHDSSNISKKASAGRQEIGPDERLHGVGNFLTGKLLKNSFVLFFLFTLGVSLGVSLGEKHSGKNSDLALLLIFDPNFSCSPRPFNA